MTDDRRSLGTALAASLAVFALGAVLAFACLPEWRAGRPRDPAFYQQELRRLGARTGLALTPGRPGVSLITDDEEVRGAYRILGERGAGWLESTHSGILVRTRRQLTRAGTPSAQELVMDFSLDGRLWSVIWQNPAGTVFRATDRAPFDRLAERFARLLLSPGQALGPPRRGTLMGGLPGWQMQDILPGTASPPQRITIGASPPQAVFAQREPGRAQDPTNRPDEGCSQILLSALIWLPISLAVAGIFLTLLLRARIDLVNGVALGLLALASASPRWLLRFVSTNTWVATVGLTFGAPGRALAILLTWSAGESLLRAVQPDFTTSLDTLRRGRLGPRGGRALLVGFTGGAGLAGLSLALYALAVLLPGLAPAGASFILPVFRANGSPVADGIWIAAGVTLIMALAIRFLPARASAWVASLAAGAALGPISLAPYPVELAANVALAGLLVWICRRFGLTALLTASLTYYLLPAALVSGRYLSWMPVSFALTAGLSLTLVGLGFVGLARSEAIETGTIPPPPFMRRLAEERRLRHEVDLLSRMQIGLLPEEMPRLEGYQIAARSVLAGEAGGDLYDFLRDDAGGLWIAAGDVAGHGYSCAVAQAMIKAGLLSLVETGETPSSVLRRLDQVLRGVSTDHSFTSLALIRLDPETGDARLANAGHPYPMVMEPGRVIEIDLPGLPLGRGPTQAYADRDFRLPRGGTLVLCSDGLFEALDRNGNAYGFERAREVVRAMGHRPAVEIVDALLNDCRRHLGSEQAPDDVTVVVVKRG